MEQLRVMIVSVLMVLISALSSAAQQSGTAANTSVPPLIPFASVATDEGGSSLSGVVSITFSLYAGQQGGAPLWTETQNNIQLDATGHYSVQLGITQTNGVPTTLFTTGEARWLGVQIAEQGEQPRVLLLSVPYALKAGDAATIGGLPPSAFVLAASPLSAASGSLQAAPLDGSSTLPNSAPPPTGGAVTGTGTVNYLPLWDSTSDIISSVLFQSGTGTTAKIGINNPTPATTLDVAGSSIVRGTLELPNAGTATAAAGKNSQPFAQLASAFNSTAGKAATQTFEWMAEPANNDTASASATLNLLFGSGTSKPAETGLHVASNGQINFASGQTFPGAGTITGITTAAGSGLTGGGTSGTLNLALTNTCAANQILEWSGSAWACATIGGGGTITGVTAGTDLTGGGTSGNVTLNLDTTKVPQLNAANTFAGNQSITGNLSATGSVSGAAATFTGVVTQAGALLPSSGTATASQGFNSQPLDSVTSVYNSTGGTAQKQDFRWLAEPVGNNSSSPSGKLDLLFGANGATPTETGLSVASNGIITFATGQTFGGGGGGGTVTSVGTGLGLKGGPITTSGTLTIDTSVVPQLGGVNTFTGNQTVNGTIFATASSLGVQATTTSVNGVGINAFSSATTGSGFGVIVEANSPSGEGVYGANNATTGGAVGVAGTSASTAGYGVEGAVNAPNGAAVYAVNNGSTGNAFGVFASSASANGFGIEGTAPVGVYGVDSQGNAIGVLGQTNSGAGIQGQANAGQGVIGLSNTGSGVYGETTSPTGSALWGVNDASSGNAAGVYGETASVSGTGVEGSSPAFGVYGTGGAAGVYGTSSTPSSLGVNGQSTATTGYGTGVFGATASNQGYGVEGEGPGIGVYGLSNIASNTGLGFFLPSGLWGDTGSAGFAGVFGTADSGYAGFFVNDPSENYATLLVSNQSTTPGAEVFFGAMPNLIAGGGYSIIGDPGCSENSGNVALQLGQLGMTSCSNYTLLGNNVGGTYLNAVSGEAVHLRIANSDQLTVTTGTVNVNGTFTAGDKKFKIDHPLDPANKYLYHTSVESSEMMNIYTGNVTTGGDGLATVQLPDWFEALNRDFRYQLTVIGQFAQAIVASEISQHQFSIRTDKPNVKVSWQVTGIRHDAYANANSIPVEVEKSSADRGRYLYPEAFGQPASARIGYEAPPPASRQVAHQRPPVPRRSNASPMPQRVPLHSPAPPMPNLQRPIPRPVPPQPTAPRVAPLPHPAALVGNLEANQK